MKIILWYQIKGQKSKASQYSFKNSYFNGTKSLVIVNPYGGKRVAPIIARDIVIPMLNNSNVSSKIIETKYSGHAHEIFQTISLEEYSNIIVVSGDGVVSEVINGIAARIGDDKNKFFESLQKHPIGIVPAGSSNGLSWCFDSFTYYDAMRNIIEGRPVKIDINQVQVSPYQGVDQYKHISVEKKTLWDVMHVTWGSVVEHDTMQERKLRWLETNLRNLFAPIYTISLKPIYRGKLRFLPAPIDEGDRQKYMYTDPKGPQFKNEMDGWKSIEGDFFFISAINLPWVSNDAKAAPGAKRNDGAIDILICKNVSRLELIKFFLNIGDGSHVKQTNVIIYLKVKELSLTSDPSNFSRNILISVSGELVPAIEYNVRSHQGGASFICKT